VRTVSRRPSAAGPRPVARPSSRSSRTTRRCCSTRCNTRAGAVAVHLLHRRDDQPADLSRPGLSEVAGHEVGLPRRQRTTSSRAPRTRSSRRTRRRTA
jgi:hypothetical protein